MVFVQINIHKKHKFKYIFLVPGKYTNNRFFETACSAEMDLKELPTNT